MMKKNNEWWMLKIGRKQNPKFVKSRMDYIIEQRIKMGKNKPSDLTNKILNYPRIILAAMRDDQTVRRLINADFVDDRKGQYNFSEFNIFTFMVVAFLAVVLFGGLIYVTGILNDTFLDIGRQNTITGVNLTEAANDTFGQMNNSIQALRLVALAIIFSEITALVIFTGFSRKHPALFIVWIFVVFLAVMLAAPISNAYESLLQSNIYEGNLASFTGANWVLLNLPIVTLLAGILGAILMFINIVRTGNEEGLGI
jgi:hypothetical protein